jgi:spoIIIJ-associated protein
MTEPTGDAAALAANDSTENDSTWHDTSTTDGGPTDDGAIDDGAIDDGAIDESAIDDGAIDDGAIDDGAIDDGTEESADDAPGTTRTRTRRSDPDPADLEREGEIAADYLEELLDIADLDGDIDMDVERDRASVSVVGGDLDHLVGREGAVLEALQELTRLAVLTQTGERSRLMLDVGGYRAGRRAVLSDLGRTTAEQVKTSGEPARLAPMTPFERKIVHDAVAAAGLRSESEGEEPQRRVVVLPA